VDYAACPCSSLPEEVYFSYISLMVLGAWAGGFDGGVCLMGETASFTCGCFSVLRHCFVWAQACGQCARVDFSLGGGRGGKVSLVGVGGGLWGWKKSVRSFGWTLITLVVWLMLRRVLPQGIETPNRDGETRGNQSPTLQYTLTSTRTLPIRASATLARATTTT